MFQRFFGDFVITDERLGDAGCVRRRQHFHSGNVHRRQLANQLNLRRASGRKDQVGYFVGYRKHQLHNLRKS